MITMMGDLWEALRMKKQDTCEQLLAACWKVSGNREKTFAHSILVSLGLKVNEFPGIVNPIKQLERLLGPGVQ